MKKWLIAALAVVLLVSGAQMAEASLFGSVLGKVFSQSRTTKKVPAKMTNDKNARYKSAMSALENLQWVGVAKGAGGNIYFNQDTMKDVTRNGERRVTVTMKNEFTEDGAKEIVKESDGDISKKDHLAYSLFLVDYGEKDCFVASHVSYYDKDGKLILEVPARNAYSDVTSRNYGKPYTAGSIEKKIQTTVFQYADREQEEEKEKAAEDV